MLDKTFVSKIVKDFSDLQNICELTSGGQKYVFKAFHKQYGNVVLKIIKPNPNVYRRTKREIRAAQIISSQNVPIIFESNIEQESTEYFWIIEEFIEGSTLRFFLNNGYNFDTRKIISFLETFLNIAIELESKKLVHRDIKPENIIYNRSLDKYWLLDFGLARHLDLESITQTNLAFALCTWGYAASEQFRNLKQQINIRTDLFSIGVVAFEMVTGYNPFIKDARDVLQVIKNIERVPIPDFNIDGDTQFLLSTFIKNMADNRLSRRPRSAKEAYEILQVVKNTIILT